MIHKIDSCMLDLVAYHEKALADEKERGSQKPWTNIIARAGSSLRRSRDLSSHRSAQEWHPCRVLLAYDRSVWSAVGSSVYRAGFPCPCSAFPVFWL